MGAVLTKLNGIFRMLVLSRYRHEKIVINNDIVINVVEIRGNKVRLGIEAPGEVPVHRYEIWQNIQRELGSSDGPSPELPQ